MAPVLMENRFSPSTETLCRSLPCLCCSQADEAARQWGSRPRRHIKAEQQSDPAAALCFCFAVSTQHGGREKRWWSAPVRPPGRRFHASSSVLVPDKLKGGPKRILWMWKSSFWSKDRSQLSSLCLAFNNIFMWYRWLNIHTVVSPMLTYTCSLSTEGNVRCLKCLWTTS